MRRPRRWLLEGTWPPPAALLPALSSALVDAGGQPPSRRASGRSQPVSSLVVVAVASAVSGCLITLLLQWGVR